MVGGADVRMPAPRPRPAEGGRASRVFPDARCISGEGNPVTAAGSVFHVGLQRGEGRFAGMEAALPLSRMRAIAWAGAPPAGQHPAVFHVEQDGALCAPPGQPGAWCLLTGAVTQCCVTRRCANSSRRSRRSQRAAPCRSKAREVGPARSLKPARGATSLATRKFGPAKSLESASGAARLASGRAVVSKDVAGVSTRCCAARNRRGCCVRRSR